MTIPLPVLRVTLIVGLCVDAGIGAIALFAQPLLPTLLDVPVKDPALTTILGGELIVAAFFYAFVLRDPQRFAPLLWVCALDQTLGVVLPLIEIGRGHIAASFMTIAPMPLQLVMVAIYVLAVVRPGMKRSATPFMQ
jgi:hypothetical protein